MDLLIFIMVGVFPIILIVYVLWGLKKKSKFMEDENDEEMSYEGRRGESQIKKL